MPSQLSIGSQAYLLLVVAAFAVFIAALAYGWLRTSVLRASSTKPAEAQPDRRRTEIPAARRAA